VIFFSFIDLWATQISFFLDLKELVEKVEKI